MAGSGRVPGKEAGSGCLCLFCMWRREDSEPGTGLWGVGEKRREGGVMPQSLPTATVSLIPVQRKAEGDTGF